MNKRNVIMMFYIFLLLLIVFYSVTYWGYDFAKKNKNYDYYAFLSLVRASENYLDNNHLDMGTFPNALLATSHSNLATFHLAFIKRVIGTDLITLFFIFAIFNIIFFYLSFYYFLGFLKMSSKRKLIAVVLFFLICGFGITYQDIGSDLVNLSSLPIAATSFQTLAYGFLFILLRESFSYIEGKKAGSTIILIILLSFFLFSLHAYIFFIYLTFLLVFSLINIIQKRSVLKRVINLAFVLISISLIYSFIWPFSNSIISLFKSVLQFQSGAIAQGSKDYLVNNPIYFFKALSFSLLGFLFFFREKSNFLKYWILSIIILVVLYFSPISFKIPLVNRFILPLKIALIILISNNVSFSRSLSNKYICFIFIILFVLLNTLNAIHAFELSLNRPNDYLLYQELSKMSLDKGLILSDDWTSNMIQAVPNCSVFFIMGGHVSNANLLVWNNQRIKNTESVLLQNDINIRNKFLSENKIRYIIINKNFNSQLSKSLRAIDTSQYSKVSETENLRIINIY